jgi:hypothetical protein
MIPGVPRGEKAYCLCLLVGRNDGGMTGPVKSIKIKQNHIYEC